jgi:hypothetical protein
MQPSVIHDSLTLHGQACITDYSNQGRFDNDTPKLTIEVDDKTSTITQVEGQTDMTSPGGRSSTRSLETPQPEVFRSFAVAWTV